MPATSNQFPLSARMKGTLYAVVVASVSLFCVAESDVFPLVLTVAAAAMAWLLIDGTREAASRPAAEAPAAPKWLLNTVVLIAALNLLREVILRFGVQSPIISLAHFIIALLLCKLFERKTARNITQIFVLSLLAVVAGTMFSSTDLVYALLLLGYLGLVSYAMVLMHLRQENARIIRRGIPRVVPESGRLSLLRGDLRTVVRQCILMVAPVAIVIFLLIPRSRGTGLQTSWGVGAYQTGFTDNVQFHDFGQLNQSDEEVMHVWLRVGDKEVGSEFDCFYFRGAVMEEYSVPTRRWYHRVLDPGDEQEVIPPTEENDQLLTQQYEIVLPTRSDANTWTLFNIGPVVDQSAGDIRYSARDMTIRLMRPLGQAYKYTVVSRITDKQDQLYPEQTVPEPVLLQPGFLGRHVVRLEGSRFNEVFDYVSPEITSLARQVAGDQLLPDGRVAPENMEAVAGAFKEYLQKNYPYSLSFKQVDPALDPTTDFLLNRKDAGGHCEYFASAMAMMCRSVGIYSRVVTGYRGGDYNVMGGYYVVRQKHAHAWAEIYVPGHGWVTEDPSPLSATSSTLGDLSLARWMREFGQMLEGYWLSAVVTFDNESRRAVMGWLQAQGTSLRMMLAEMGGWFATGDLLGIATVVGPLLALLVVGAWVARRWRRERRLLRLTGGNSSWRAMVKLSNTDGFLDELISLLEQHGQERRRDQTPREFVEECGGRLGTAMGDARWLIATGYHMRFGHAKADSELKRRISQALRDVRQALRGHAAASPVTAKA